MANLETLGSDKALDLGHLDGGLLALTTRYLTLDAVLLLHLVSLVESEKLPDASGTLRTQTAGHRGLCTVFILSAYYALFKVYSQLRRTVTHCTTSTLLEYMSSEMGTHQ